MNKNENETRTKGDHKTTQRGRQDKRNTNLGLKLIPEKRLHVQSTYIHEWVYGSVLHHEHQDNPSFPSLAPPFPSSLYFLTYLLPLFSSLSPAILTLTPSHPRLQGSRVT